MGWMRSPPGTFMCRGHILDRALFGRNFLFLRLRRRGNDLAEDAGGRLPGQPGEEISLGRHFQ